MIAHILEMASINYFSPVYVDLVRQCQYLNTAEVSPKCSNARHTPQPQFAHPMAWMLLDKMGHLCLSSSISLNRCHRRYPGLRSSNLGF